MNMKDVAVGQVWNYTDKYVDYDYQIDRISPGNKCICTIVRASTKIYESDQRERPLGMAREFDTWALINPMSVSYKHTIVSGFKKRSNRNRPKLSIVSCRGCGNSFSWIKGTSKKNYLCLPCRGQ
jgi:hypothetical protein